MAEALRANID